MFLFVCSDEIQDEKKDDAEQKQDNEKAQGEAVGDYGTMDGNDVDGNDDPPVTFSSSWKMNIILAAICCWFAMVLTSWGSVIASGTVANPSAGHVSMWMVITSQWLILLLYLWTLVAPAIFPDRDFS